MKLILLALLTLGLYAPLWSAGWVYEDANYSRAITQPWTWGDPRARLVHPRVVTDASFALNAAVGAGPRGYHLTNLALHLLVGVLVWLIVRPWSEGSALLAAALALVHPVQTEAVAYISSGRSELLAAIGVLLALLAWSRGWIVGTIIAGLLAVAAKESAAAGLVLIIPLTAIWRDGHLDRRSLWPLTVWSLAILAVGGAFWVRTPHVWYVGRNLLMVLTLLTRIVLPIGQTVSPALPLAPLAVQWLALALVAAGLVLAWRKGGTVRWWAWSVAACLTPRVLAPQPEPPHEHALYLPVVLSAIAVAHLARPWIANERPCHV